MNLPFQEIDLAQLKPGSVLVFNVDTQDLADLRNFIQGMLRRAGSQFRDHTLVFLKQGESLEHVDEKSTNKIGCYRRGTVPEMQDIHGPKVVEVEVRPDQQVVWVNVNGKCALRCCQIETLIVRDGK